MPNRVASASLNSISLFRALPAFVLILGTLPPATAQQGTFPEPPPSVDFETDIFPIFSQRCLSCHGPEQQMGEFRLDSKAIALEGGVSGPNILPGQGDKSPLLQRVAGTGDLNAMPMTGDRLTPQQIALVRAWIDQGAAWPAGVGSGVGQVTQHWAYQPPRRPKPPSVDRADTVRNPIDSFLLARLEKEGLSFSPEAQKATLIRRLSLDLRGLPPSIEEVDRFLADESPGAYAKLVNQMLKSPHFGEHWAGYWLDLARYADTNGYESDEPRTIWAYRDWVIDAFNRNLPFDQFTAEQLAGDLLPDATIDQIVATGFHRNTMLNNEAGSKNDEFYDAAVKDRVDTTATVWLGSTVGCAQCHDHKYDPFKQDEYYRLYAIFNNTADSAIKLSEELEVFKGDADELRRREAEVNAGKAILDAPTAELTEAQREWEARTAPLLPRWRDAWQVLEPDAVTSGSDTEFNVLPDSSALLRESGDGSDPYEVELRAQPGLLTGIRIEALPHESLPSNGPGEGEGGAFSISGIEAEAWSPLARSRQEEAMDSAPAWSTWHVIGPFRVRSRKEAFETSFPPETNSDLSVVYEEGHLAWNERKDWTDGRVHYLRYLPDASDTNCASYAYRTVEVREPTTVHISLGSLKGLKVWLNSEVVFSTDPTREIAPDQEELRLDLGPGKHEILLKLTNDVGPYGFYFNPYWGAEKNAQLRFASASADHGSWNPITLGTVLDARSQTAWSFDPESPNGPRNAVAVLGLQDPVELTEGTTVRVKVFHGSEGRVGRFRISSTSLPKEQLAALQETPARARQTLAIDPSERTAGETEQLAAHFRSIAPQLESHRRKHADLEASLEAFRKAHTTTTLVMRELDEPRATHIQERGSFLDLLQQVKPGVPPVLDFGRPSDVPNRLALARWLTSDENPLTARVRVNHIWNRIFGRGLVTTPEDFGTQGDTPTHPELMDWLATEFMRLGWDTQALIRTIALSAAYRQSSAVSADAMAQDPNNTLLSRGARYRVPAETVRDIALASSGQLSRAIGGPSVFPPQPPEVFGDHFIEGGFKQWPTSEGADRYRRGLYTFYKRTVVYPAFMNFDAPDRTVCTVDRSSSNTPLQALNTLNDPTFFEAARSLAGRMLAASDASQEERIVHGFRSVLARQPSTQEVGRLTSFLDRMDAKYAVEPDLLTERAHGESTANEFGFTDRELAPWVMAANVLLNLDETFTRE